MEIACSILYFLSFIPVKWILIRVFLCFLDRLAWLLQWYIDYFLMSTFNLTDFSSTVACHLMCGFAHSLSTVFCEKHETVVVQESSHKPYEQWSQLGRSILLNTASKTDWSGPQKRTRDPNCGTNLYLQQIFFLIGKPSSEVENARVEAILYVWLTRQSTISWQLGWLVLCEGTMGGRWVLNEWTGEFQNIEITGHKQ